MQAQKRPQGGRRALAPTQPSPLPPLQGLLYAASYATLAQLPVANCSLHESCGACLLARDPYCAWSGSACRPVSLATQQPNA